MWLLKQVGWILCPIIVCHGTNCSEIVIDVCGQSFPFDIFGE